MTMILNDQAALSFLTQQAAYIEREVYAVKYEDIDYQDLIFADTSAGDYTKSIEFYSMDGAGKAEWFDAKSRDVPLVNTSRQKFTTAIHMGAIGYSYDNQTLGYAQKLGINLSADDGLLARRVYEEFIDDLVKVGNVEKGITGLYNDANVTAATVSGATAPARLWSGKSATAVLSDLNEPLTAVIVQSLRVEKADTVLLPVSAYRELQTTPFNVNDSRPILNVFLDQNPGVTVKPMGGLETAGAGGTRRMVVYRNNRDALKLHLPVALQFLEPMRMGPMLYHVPGYFRTAGIEIRLPNSARYRDGF